MADAQGGQESGQSRVLTLLQGIQEILRGLVRHTLQAGQLSLVQIVEVRDVCDQSPVHELVDELLSQSLDVHGAARAEKLEALFQLGGTREARAAVGGLSLFLVKRG